MLPLHSTPQADSFIGQVTKLTNITLTPEKFTQDIEGYRVPLFPEANRNHSDDRPDGDLTPIKSLVMHYTVINLPDTLVTFTKNIPDNRVSSTYVITEHDPQFNLPGGKVIQVTPEEKRAWDAGISKWRELVNLNGVSLGIEHVNKGLTTSPQDHWYPFDLDQIHASGLLSQAIIQKYHIPPVYVVGHADIAPGRKEDPGILFPWGKLYTDYGVGAWLTQEEQTPTDIQKYNPEEPLPQEVSISFLSRYLKKYGYDLEETDVPTPQFSHVLKAFKSHFSYNQHPEGYNDIPDMKDMFWIWGLTAKYKIYL